MFKILLMTSVISLGILGGLFAWQPKTVGAASSNSTIIVQTIPGPTVAEKVIVRTKSSWPWYVARGSGMVAAIALVILMLSGIGQVTGYTYRFLDPLTAWASHRALGIAFVAAIVLHIVSLLFDKFVPFSIWQVLVPWLTSYKPAVIAGHSFGSLWVALGIFAFYLSVIILITSLIWVEKKPYTWKFFHLLSYITIFFVFMHGLYSGTDLVHGVLRLVWIGMGILVVLFSLHRLWRAKTT